MKYLRAGFKCLIVAVVALGLAGCLHRDPYVRLPNGYGIAAVSWGSPCSLWYQPSNDERVYSDWKAYHIVMQDETGKQSETYILDNDTTNEMLDFDTKQKWESERRARNARPATVEADEFSGITGFKRRDPFVIGDYDGGYSILNTTEDSIDCFATKENWERKVMEAGLSIDHLVDPKSFFVQTRHPIVYEVVGGFLLITLPWILWPLRAERRGTVKNTSG